MFVLLALALIIGLLVARVRGGTLDALGRIQVRLPWLAAGIVVAVVVAVFVPGAGTVGWLAAALLAAALSAANRRLPGLFLLFVGLALNAAAITANHSHMPVSTRAVHSAGLSEQDVAGSGHYVLADHSSRLRVLGDVIPFPFWGAPSVLSAGDVLIVSGVGLFAALAPVRASRSLRTRQARRDQRRRHRDAALVDGSGNPSDDDPDGPAPDGEQRAPRVAVLPGGAGTAGATATARRGTMASVTDESERRRRHGEEEA